MFRPTIEILDESDSSDDEAGDQPSSSNIPIEVVGSSDSATQPISKACDATTAHQPIRNKEDIRPEPLFTKVAKPECELSAEHAESSRLLTELQDLSEAEVAASGQTADKSQKLSEDQTTTEDKILQLATHAGSTTDRPVIDNSDILEGLD